MENKRYIYFCEGKTDKKLIETLAINLKVLPTGKYMVFNATQEKFNSSYLLKYEKSANYVLVFDTDKEEISILKQNIKFLQDRGREVILIPQVRNLEDELIRSCKIKSVAELTKSKSIKEFKTAMIKDRNFDKKLLKYSFDIEKLWYKQPGLPFDFVRSMSYKIKL